ncbi:MAG: hypothetical protein IJV06_00190 [Bacteroidaceae bacterium]|nr:hypothetical protein [Bacteroidaceae bacterium]MBQ9639974.1 hypothetical protein [Bacteroidaceae bacterium]
MGETKMGRFALSTTHGYQINPYVFAGVGAGVNCYRKSGKTSWGVPIFADVRGNLLNNSISPFLDLKIGYSVADISGFYFSPSIGCRFAISQKAAFTLSIGYEMQKGKALNFINDVINKSNYWGDYTSYLGDYTSYLGDYTSYLGDYTKEVKNAKINYGGLVLRAGIEF